MVVVIRPFIFGEHMTIPVSDRLSQLYVGNGTNKRFDFTFRVFQQEDETGISIRKKGAVEFETLDPSTYVVQINQDDMGGYITFVSAPAAGTYFYIAGTTNLDQLLDITNYDNFYPDAIERALDKLTALLQERSTEIDQEKQSRILADLKYDALAMEREDNLENRLTSYINAMIGITNPAIFDGISDRMIITKDGRTQREFNETLPFWTDEFVKFVRETHLREEQILDSTNSNLQTAKTKLDTKIVNETTRALAAEENLQVQISTSTNGIKYFDTEAQLLNFTPTEADPKQAYAFDTKKNYLWVLKSGSTTEYEWKDEGLSTLDFAKNYNLKRSSFDISFSRILGTSINQANSILRIEIDVENIDFIDNCYIDNNGNLVNFENTKVTDFLNVRAGDSFTMTPSYTFLAAIYDKNFQFIQTIESIDGTEYTFEVTNQNAKYIRFNLSKVLYTRVYFNTKQLEIPTFKASVSNIADAVNELVSPQINPNIIQNASFKDGYFLDTNANEVAFSSYKYTDEFIELNELTEYVISLASLYVGIFYDENFNIISSIPASTAQGTSNYRFITPKFTKYCKFNISKSDSVQSVKKYTMQLSLNQKSEWSGKKIAWYGTSIPAGYPHSGTEADRDIFSHANLAVHDLGGMIINKCVPAGGVSTNVGLSFVRTTDTINYQNSLLNLIGTVNEPDLVVFDYGVNDYDQSPSDIDLFKPTDPFNPAMSIDSRNTATFIGAYNTIIDAMLTAKPDLKFCFITHFSQDNANPGIVRKKDHWKTLVQCQQSLAEYWSAPILNLHEKTGYRNRNNFDSITPYMPDHIHPASGDGRSVEQLRNIMRSFLISIA